jgi:two-component system heavy metal sensor histidine kinase CusS
MPRARWSLASRLAAWYAVAAFLLVAGAALVQYRSLITVLAEEDDQALVERLRSTMRAGPEQLVAPKHGPRERLVVRFLDESCRPIGGATLDLPQPSCISLRAGHEPIRDLRSPSGVHWKIAVAHIGQAWAAWVEVLLDRSTDDRVMSAYLNELVVVLGASLLVAAALGYGIARRGLRPLRVFAQRVTEIDARSLSQRLSKGDEEPTYPRELQALVTSLDDMLDRLEGAFRALTEFSAELAHELRTPIHVLRQHAEIALRRGRSAEEYRDVLGANLEELDRMRRMVDDILFLARAEDPRAVIECASLRLADEAAAVIEFLSADATDRGVSLSSNVPTSLELFADRMLLRRALVNVLGNALRHTPAGGRVTVSAHTDGVIVALDVCDTGVGIPPELLPRVFDRHARGPDLNARNPGGAGLGLAIVRGIMALHGGTAEATSPLGEGTKITLMFPGNGTTKSRIGEYQAGSIPHSIPPKLSRL